jgi:hypothetical protein
MSIDIKRSFIGREVGNKTVDPNTTFNAGMVGEYNSSGNIVVSDGTAPCGILKWNKTSTVYGVSADEAVVMNTDGSTASALVHANVSNVRVRSLAGGAGTLYVNSVDYSFSATNGTVTRLANIASGGTVYVTYTFQLNATDITSGANAPGNVGLNFQLNTDDTAGSGKITLIQGFSTVFTDQYDTTRTYAINDQLSVNGSGLFTNFYTISTGRPGFGRVVSVPTASDPYLGVEGNFYLNVNGG